MAKYIFQGQFSDLSGNAVTSGSITAYLAGTTTLASIYASSTSTTATNSVTSDVYGKFYFWISDGDYSRNQNFKIVLSKTGFLSRTYDNIIIYPSIDFSSTGKISTHGVTQSSSRISATGAVTGFTQNASSSVKFVSSSSTFTGNYGASAFTIGDVVRTLKKHGLMTT